MKTKHPNSSYSARYFFLAVFFILGLISCNENELDLSLDNDYKLEQYETVHIHAYKAMVEQEIETAKKQNESFIKRLELMSNSFLRTPGSGKTKIVVPDDYSTIQEAVNAAPEGSEIKVNGNFNEIVYIVFRNDLTIKGVNDASIESYEFAIVLFGSNNIQIKDLTVRGHIFMGNSEHISIKNNDISGSSRGYGVYMNNTAHCTIKDNYIHDLTGEDLAIGGGIYGVSNNDFNEINGNIVTRARLGIELINDSDNNIIKDNTVSDIRQVGIALVINCDQNKVIDNTITYASWAGLAIVYNSNENEVKELETSFCTGSPPPGFRTAGIGILESNNNSIEDVQTFNNTNGMGIAFSMNNIMSKLEANNNAIYGLQLESTVESNIIKNSEASDNGLCDLVDLGINNSFVNSDFENICD